MLATLVTAVVNGLHGELVQVEIDIAPGLPACHIVGLPDAALSEARERVRGAIRNSGFEYPASRITVNLAPADRRKRGAAYDVAIGVGILVASGQIRRGGGSWALLGELSLSGSVRPVTGVLPMVATLARAGHRRIGVPRANVAEAELFDGVEVVGLDGLDDAARLVAGPRGRTAGRAQRRPTLAVTGVPVGGSAAGNALAGGLEAIDLADVRGQRHARWGLEIALAGGHNLLLVGPPGAGKTLLGRAIPGLLPPLSEAEALEVTVIESVAGLLGDGAERRRRPFRAPHHTSSSAALVGGGPWLLPGEVTLAHTSVC
jgi:magnesium chelatase family protein